MSWSSRNWDQVLSNHAGVKAREAAAPADRSEGLDWGHAAMVRLVEKKLRKLWYPKGVRDELAYCVRESVRVAARCDIDAAAGYAMALAHVVRAFPEDFGLTRAEVHP